MRDMVLLLFWSFFFATILFFSSSSFSQRQPDSCRGWFIADQPCTCHPSALCNKRGRLFLFKKKNSSYFSTYLYLVASRHSRYASDISLWKKISYVMRRHFMLTAFLPPFFHQGVDCFYANCHTKNQKCVANCTS